MFRKQNPPSVAEPLLRIIEKLLEHQRQLTATIEQLAQKQSAPVYMPAPPPTDNTPIEVPDEELPQPWIPDTLVAPLGGPPVPVPQWPGPNTVTPDTT